MGAVREGGAIHTEGEWFAGGGAWVAAANPINGDISGSDDVDYYGGHLIGESISSCNIPIISAAPDMFKALLAVKQKLHFVGMPGEKVCKVTGKSDWSDEIKLIEAALTKAVTRVPVPEKVAPVAPSVNVGEGWRVIGDDETLVSGDEYSDAINTDEWSRVVVSIGLVKSESSLCRSVCRRKISPVEPVAAPENDPDFVGAGYRLIGADEAFIEGDEVDINPPQSNSNTRWKGIGVCFGIVKRESALAYVRCRRKVEPVTQSITIDGTVFSVGAGGAGGSVEPVDQDSVGYRIVGQDETLIAGDEYWNKIGDYWEQVYSERGKQKQCSSLSLYRVRRRIVNDGDPVDAEFEVLGQQKPPLGLMPRQIWLENRRDDIYDAIARYRDADKEVSRDWLNELLDLDNEMRPF